MNKNFFEIGDVVTLNSPGPNMTVSWLPPESSIEKSVDCLWFDGGTLHTGTFHQRSLHLVPKDEH